MQNASAWTIAACVLFCGCLAGRPPPSLLLEVPFVEQSPERCGVAAVSMVAGAYGVELDTDALDRYAHIPVLGGSIPDLLAEGARRQGLDATSRKCAEQELRDFVEQGIPPILMLGPTGRDVRGHFVVVTGYDSRTGALRVHSGRSRNRWLPAKTWRPRWADAGCLVVTIRRH